MYRNVSLDAHLSALLFLGCAGLMIALVITIPLLAFWRRSWLRHAVTAQVALVIGYGGLLLAFSLFSRERVLVRGEEKYFCELDCHLAYSVQNVERVKAIGNTQAQGNFCVVTVRSRFDENTTAPWRPRDVPLITGPFDLCTYRSAGIHDRALEIESKCLGCDSQHVALAGTSAASG